MKPSVIFFVILALILLITSVLIIFGVIYKPPLVRTSIRTDLRPTDPKCLSNKVSCDTDADCKRCTESGEFNLKCVEITRNSDQENKYGDSGKFCLPEKPKQPCNHKNGGIWTWTGWADTEQQEWECLCTYPNIAGGNGCERLNPDICKGGTWTYDATKETEGPKSKFCKCPANHYLLVTESYGKPLCIPKNNNYCKDEKMCNSIYSNSKFIS